MVRDGRERVKTASHIDGLLPTITFSGSVFLGYHFLMEHTRMWHNHKTYGHSMFIDITFNMQKGTQNPFLFLLSKLFQCKRGYLMRKQSIRMMVTLYNKVLYININQCPMLL